MAHRGHHARPCTRLPAPGQPGKLPFWHGDTLGRPAELGRALGSFTRELACLPAERAEERVSAAGLDAWASANLVSYLGEQREATGHVPDDRTMVVERFRDELGDWRMVVHSPLGARVHGPWALAIAGRLRERYGVDAQAMHADDGIVIRIPDMDEPPGLDLAVFDADDIERIVVDELGGSALFAARFRECAARSLLLPRRRPDKRMPLWQQRKRAAQLLAVASKYTSFPIVLETMRECLQDVFDVPGLVQLMRDLSGRKVRMVEVETPEPSPTRAPCSSTTSARSCTRATPRSPNAAPKHSRSTPHCSPNSSARPIFASCSTPTRSPKPNANSSAWPPTAAPATWRA